jgi:hypothetical protein
VIGANERNADDFLGVSPKMCVFSEVGAHTSFENLYKTLQPAILANNTRQSLNGTPRGENHWHRFFTESESDPKFYTDLTQVLFPEKHTFWETPLESHPHYVRLRQSLLWSFVEFCRA